MKIVLKKIGKAIWSAIPWVLMSIGLTCWLMIPLLYANESAELESQIAALEAENTRYELEIIHLNDDIEWLRSLVETDDAEDSDGQIQQ